ncbi:amino acid ABC transporter ATP-binding protein, partial [Salmonella enterica subsp. enterica]|nr:amino acid ABC transporter ATP-binding protein [Salmonella enterica subsp. enterica serovar Chester]
MKIEVILMALLELKEISKEYSGKKVL